MEGERVRVDPYLRFLFHCLLILLLLGLVSSFSQNCLPRNEVNPKRYLVINGTSQEFQLGVSKSITHQLVTQVLYIFLKEVLGYPSVSIVKTPNRDLLGLLTSLKINYTDLTNIHRWPNNYINIEVWVPSDISLVISMGGAKISDVGNIAPPARYGLYLAVSKNLSGLNEIDWKEFTKKETASRYRLSNANMSYIKLQTKGKTGRFYCESKDHCSSGIFTPPQCEGHHYCATLLTDYIELSGFLKEEVLSRKLYMEIAWVGGNLDSVLTFLTGQDVRVLLTTTDPGPLTLLARPDFTLIPVTQLPCKYYMEYNTTCNFQYHRLAKLVPTKLIDWANPAFETLQKMNFDSVDYIELLENWHKALSSGQDEKSAIHTAACDWLRKHEKAKAEGDNYWDLWEPSDHDWNKIYIGGIFPLASKGFQSPGGIVLAADLAGKAVNLNPNVLRDYNLDLLVDNGQCRADLVLKNFIDHIKNPYFKRLAGILGPACSESIEPLVGVAKHYKTVVISYSAEGSTFSREKYPYFFRTIGENKQYQYVYNALLKELKWKKVASLTKDGTKYAEYISETETLLKKNGINFVGNRKFPNEWNSGTMKQILEDLKKDQARIIIVDVNDDEARAVMCAAYHLNMTANHGYVWFLPLWLSHNWYAMANSSHSNSSLSTSCSTKQMEIAINGHLSLSHTFFAPDDHLTHENITVGEWRERYRNISKMANMTESNYAGYTYDAMWTYAYALDKLLRKNQTYLSNLHDESASRNFVEFIKQTEFEGVSGHISFKEGASRENPINILQWLNLESKIVGTFTPNTSDSEHGKLVLYEIVWLTGDKTPPWDGTPPEPECLLSSFAVWLNVGCEPAIVIVAVLLFILLAIVGISAFIFIKNRYDKKVELTEKYMKTLGIDLLDDTTISSLDKWEIPKDMVVINRRLGEGAFGTVYGGEAYFEDKGWVAVAVKTLKAGSTTEEKLDFLSEAEVMKRFDHKNIVKLLGICTKSEPIYNVMEFMLYGDLKTFLLARRHLVNDRLNEDSDEVSSKKLTSMALDVARALSYLAEMKYVHRDVASRNCLLNSSRVVKLGDFGMTRPTFENDYYKFSRKGLLPVRWMAPESLGLGLFTPASDVWSYGVLLYEIITFGSFPFQGLSNNQVLEHVKQGNTLTIPTGVKPQLENLIKSCWRLDSKERPHASEIVECIANNPRLLTACLDVPIKSVQMEDTGQLEMSMERNSGARRRSITGGMAAVFRRASAGSLGGVIVPDGPNDGSVTPLLPKSPSQDIRFVALKDLDNADYCNHIENHKDSFL